MPSDPSAPFEELLRRARQAAGLTREELAERAELSRRGIANLEGSARLRLRKDTVALLVAALGGSARSAARRSRRRRSCPIASKQPASIQRRIC
jgi:transcriptional regulator with XRE-family HTH domain